jgi:predicted O-methyltransferase YrrM
MTILRPWWTPVYVRDRLARARYERRHPEAPWLTRQANAFLESFLRPTHVGLEWGSGRSTLWLARRIGALTSVEDGEDWYAEIERRLGAAGIANVRYRLCPPGRGDAAYVEVADEFDDASLDFALVDGSFRCLCANRALAKLRPGGVLVVDNANRFLPSASRSPKSVPSHASGRRDLGCERIEGMGWDDFRTRVRDWRCLWTSDGVADTALWFRPAAE